MRLEYQILAAFALDLLLGDPRWLPHPVRLIGFFATHIETLIRKAIPFAYLAGIIGWLFVVGSAGATVWGILTAAAVWNPIAHDVAAVLILYTTIAARDLVDHSNNVRKALDANDLPEARRRVSMLVGRDTANLDEAGVARAAVESVAESMVDGVTSPLFFAALGGPIGAMCYKAINTLDSMWGHRDERYLHYGWAAARTDDVANFIPARVTAPLVALAAACLGYRAGGALRVFLRDGRKHPSPNSGLSEAAMAGALSVQLGGLNYYDGEPEERAVMGDPGEPLGRVHIRRANVLMLATASLALGVFVAARVAASQWWGI